MQATARNLEQELKKTHEELAHMDKQQEEAKAPFMDTQATPRLIAAPAGQVCRGIEMNQLGGEKHP